LPGETIATDGKVLCGSYQIESDNPHSTAHPAIILVSAYIVLRGLILEPVSTWLKKIGVLFMDKSRVGKPLCVGAQRLKAQPP
jgi:hypothetical protein